MYANVVNPTRKANRRVSRAEIGSARRVFFASDAVLTNGHALRQLIDCCFGGVFGSRSSLWKNWTLYKLAGWLVGYSDHPCFFGAEKLDEDFKLFSFARGLPVNGRGR